MSWVNLTSRAFQLAAVSYCAHGHCTLSHQGTSDIVKRHSVLNTERLMGNTIFFFFWSANFMILYYIEIITRERIF